MGLDRDLGLFFLPTLEYYVLLWYLEGSLSVSEEETFYYPMETYVPWGQVHVNQDLFWDWSRETRERIHFCSMILTDYGKISCGNIQMESHDWYVFFVKTLMRVHCCSPCREIHVLKFVPRSASQFMIDWKWSDMVSRVNTQYFLC